jgi:hypothetical protein
VTSPFAPTMPPERAADNGNYVPNRLTQEWIRRDKYPRDLMSGLRAFPGSGIP